jgi:hypothetical protein
MIVIPGKFGRPEYIGGQNPCGTIVATIIP